MRQLSHKPTAAIVISPEARSCGVFLEMKLFPRRFASAVNAFLSICRDGAGFLRTNSVFPDERRSRRTAPASELLELRQRIEAKTHYAKIGGIMKRSLTSISALFLVVGFLGCSTPLTTREKGAGIGTLGGAAAGGIIGSAVGHAGAGAALGGLLGLGAGTLVGDQLQGQESKQDEQQRKLEQSQREIQRQQRQIDRLRGELES